MEPWYNLHLIDDNADNYVKGFYKTETVHGGFYFKKDDNTIYLIMLSQPKRDIIRASIDINNLSVEQKEALTKDFIQKTTFKGE